MANLTGRTRHRLGWFGKLILQVEQSYIHGLVFEEPKVSTFWVDAEIHHQEALLKGELDL